MSKYFHFLVVTLFFSGCVHQLQRVSPQNWQTRGEAVKAIIESEIALNAYDSADVYQKNGLYYASRRNRGAFMYSPAEAKEQLLDSVVFITTPTHSYHWEFDKGIPNGRWLYLTRFDMTLYLAETYRAGQLLKREKFKYGQTLYEIETYRDGQLLKREEFNKDSKK